MVVSVVGNSGQTGPYASKDNAGDREDSRPVSELVYIFGRLSEHEVDFYGFYESEETDLCRA